jgi:hypothetical protein
MLASFDQPIVETAIQLSMELPDTPALEVLDLAMRGHHGEEPDFASRVSATSDEPHPAYASDLQVPSPFIDLLRRAFDPQWDPREMLLLANPEPQSPAEQARYQEAAKRRDALVQAFGVRYRLWGMGIETPQPDPLPRDLML